MLDHREHVESRSGQGDRFEEVAGQQGVGLRAQELGPRTADALGRRVYPGFLQHLPYHGCGHLDAQHKQFAEQAAIAPAGILPHQAQHQGANRAHGLRATRALGPGPGRVAACEQVAVPAQDSVRAHQQTQPTQHIPSGGGVHRDRCIRLERPDQHRQHDARPLALPGGYPNVLAPTTSSRAQRRTSRTRPRCWM